MTEPAAERERRMRLRVLFDGVADVYEASRRGYPDEIVDLVLDTAGVGAGDPVLEIGCGTGQLTRSLAARHVALTSIDIGPSMVEHARRHVADGSVRFEVTPFESFATDDGSFALVASATAIHWVDPDVRWVKAARLLRPGGWLAVLGTGEQYDEPLGPALRELWISLSEDKTWATEPQVPLATVLTESGLFGSAVVHKVRKPLTLTPDMVVGVESTRATTLSYDDGRRERFFDGLRSLLDGLETVSLHQETTLTMVPVSRADATSPA